LRRFGVIAGADRALDFGCGLGRLSRALGERFADVLGMDISPAMAEQATRLNRRVAACRFVVNPCADLRGVPSDEFDLVISLVTLQHVSQRNAIRSCIREFLRVAAPGGVIVLQLPIRVAWRVRFRPRALAARVIWRLPVQPAVIKRALGAGSLTLTALSERSVRAILVDNGAKLLTVFPDRAVGPDAVPSACHVVRKR
jgi:SAM-dependent methyltransferase